MIKKSYRLLLILVIAGLLGGCWDRREISDAAVILGAGIDLTANNQIRLSVQIARIGAFGGGESSGGGREAASWVIAAEGNTVEDAEKKLTFKVPRDLYWGHCAILVVGEEMAKRGTGKIIDFFLRHREPRENMWFLVAREEAKGILEANSELAKTSAHAASFLSRMGSGCSVRLWQYDEMLLGKGVSPVAAGVAVKKAGVTPQAGQENVSETKEVEITGTAVFNKDKLVGWLDNDETQGLLWLKNEIKYGIITIPSINEPNQEISITTYRGSTTITPKYDGENLIFNVIIKAEGELAELNGTDDPTKPEVARDLEDKVGEEIKRRATKTLKKVQNECGVDIFGFGNAFQRKYKKDWKELKDNWDEEFAQAEVNISVEADIQTIGLFNRQMGTPEI